MKWGLHLVLPLFFVFEKIANAQNAPKCAPDDACCLAENCCLTGNAIELSAIGLIPIIAFVLGAIPVRKKLMLDAARNATSIPAASLKGYALGILFLVLALVGMLFAFHSCGIPDGWLPITIILGVISLILLIVAFTRK